MDNRLNRIRKEMSVLRADMLRAEDRIRDQVNHDQDCTLSAMCLMEMRAQMTALVREWTRLGGRANLPTVDERLKQRRGSSTKALAAKALARSARLPKAGKRHVAARA